MKELTKAEEQIMHILWKRGKGFVKELMADLPKPRPAYNTVSTIIRILEKKGFVGHEAYGKSHRYYPLVSQKDYSSFLMKGMLKNYFNSSVSNMLSFFAREEGLDIKEMEEIKSMIRKMEE